MPDLRAQQASLTASLDTQQLDQDTHLNLAENLDRFLARLRDNTDTATIEDR